MYYCINRLFVWLMRARHCRGFGVQSPYDYSFIRYVINEHYSYYAYSYLRKEFPDIDGKTRKLCQLYFRIANFLQPGTVVDYSPDVPVSSRYVSAGCRKALIATDMDVEGRIDMFIISAERNCDFCRTVLDKAMDRAGTGSVFVVEGIKSGKRAKALWRDIINDERTGVTFDLYYAGIVFFDRSRYKQNYIVNF